MVTPGGLQPRHLVYNDGGASWAPANPPAITNRWSAVASSADGSDLIAIGTSANPGETDLYLSHDGGTTWGEAGVQMVDNAKLAKQVRELTHLSDASAILVF